MFVGQCAMVVTTVRSRQRSTNVALVMRMVVLAALLAIAVTVLYSDRAPRSHGTLTDEPFPAASASASDHRRGTNSATITSPRAPSTTTRKLQKVHPPHSPLTYASFTHSDQWPKEAIWRPSALTAPPMVILLMEGCSGSSFVTATIKNLAEKCIGGMKITRNDHEIFKPQKNKWYAEASAYAKSKAEGQGGTDKPRGRKLSEHSTKHTAKRTSKHKPAYAQTAKPASASKASANPASTKREWALSADSLWTHVLYSMRNSSLAAHETILINADRHSGSDPLLFSSKYQSSLKALRKIGVPVVHAYRRNGLDIRICQTRDCFLETNASYPTFEGHYSTLCFARRHLPHDKQSEYKAHLSPHDVADRIMEGDLNSRETHRQLIHTGLMADGAPMFHYESLAAVQVGDGVG
mmetsp:Transcript_56205/g.155002  ORF Transcript_56205/g.155002 Transcript_56205/m.155002 type:complete len:409 (+) Transcript_56205:252-1478(+)